MRKIGIGTTILVSFLLTISLTGILYLGKMLFGLPFVPENLTGWLVRAGAGPFTTLYNWFVNRFTAGDQTPAQAGDLANLVLSIALFLLIGVLVGLLFHLLAGRKAFALDWVDGVAIGALFGAPLLFVSLNSDASAVNPVIQAAWLALVFIIWGVALASVYQRLGKLEAATSTPTTAVLPPGESEAETDIVAETNSTDSPQLFPEVSADTIDRRQFLLRLGASTAAIAAISGVAAAALDNPERTAARRQTLPVADPETVSFYNRAFRRFSIVRLQPGATAGEVSVLALGAEYPDQHYVTVWIGEQSPIVVYENIETALAAYRPSTGSTDTTVDVIWLDR